MITTKPTTKYSKKNSNAAILIAACALLAGCATQNRVVVQRVNVPIPVECKEPVPARPAMPTEALRLGATVDDFARAAMAEIERREGYEEELLTALESCRTPITSPRERSV